MNIPINKVNAEIFNEFILQNTFSRILCCGSINNEKYSFLMFHAFESCPLFIEHYLIFFSSWLSVFLNLQFKMQFSDKSVFETVWQIHANNFSFNSITLMNFKTSDSKILKLYYHQRI